ncbi:multicopper oxidase [Dothidotthia symphoricarpi CBS 119687]|uniref:laccase n=1 Tax=Dothidotthia symphoricarpi CBS 119687 TaxID=1392245 RepID=A0A6A6A0A1_9PLEO|nr:multicopper oxidase [Dothidotthia symphoricarpi CBS 119687]KAF2124574.1 multicopper oxidase [Dothidotthia symphoricarpi CBS 119687]
MFFHRVVGAVALLSAVSASSSFGHRHKHPSLPRSNLYPRAACSGNTADTRSEWCDYPVDTDYATEVPDTGVTREYWLELTDVTVSPDGVSRSAMAVNGTIPGPTLFADWGDTVTVHVINSLTTSNNGTSMHFHGIRQNYTNDQDGVSSITQCPTAPGDTITYTWRATQYGSTWYHSHWALQAWQGIFGGIVINGPATSNYDEDLGMLFLNDWDHQTVDELYISAESSGPPTLDNGLINGTNTYDDGGSRFSTAFTSGTSYRIRLVNAAVDTHFRFMIDNHTMTVIAADLVPIVPYETTVLTMGMGQRYDIIVTADQASVADNFWLRAIPQSACSDNDNIYGIKGIVYYGDAASDPTTSAYDYDDDCDDETSNLVPYISKTVGTQSLTEEEGVTVGFNTDMLFRWYMNSTTMVVDWEDPTLSKILAGNTTYATSNAVIELPTANQWFYLVIATTLSIPHPIHLHGHDFFILAQASGTYSDSVTLNLDNPPRRDTAMLPASGYLVIAFETDNPGAWLMHCHIGWHTSEGFAIQFVERADEIEAITNADRLSNTCSNWSTFQTANSIEQEDSGV